MSPPPSVGVEIASPTASRPCRSPSRGAAGSWPRTAMPELDRPWRRHAGAQRDQRARRPRAGGGAALGVRQARGAAAPRRARHPRHRRQALAAAVRQGAQRRRSRSVDPLADAQGGAVQAGGGADLLGAGRGDCRRRPRVSRHAGARRDIVESYDARRARTRAPRLGVVDLASLNPDQRRARRRARGPECRGLALVHVAADYATLAIVRERRADLLPHAAARGRGGPGRPRPPDRDVSRGSAPRRKAVRADLVPSSGAAARGAATGEGASPRPRGADGRARRIARLPRHGGDARSRRRGARSCSTRSPPRSASSSGRAWPDAAHQPVDAAVLQQRARVHAVAAMLAVLILAVTAWQIARVRPVVALQDWS